MIFIVIPVHNRRDFTRECLLSLRKQTYKNFKVIIVDDGSMDGTGDMIEKDFPEVIPLKGDGELWWTGATNMGVE
jgi:GT2 family glycosyltransferase